MSAFHFFLYQFLYLLGILQKTLLHAEKLFMCFKFCFTVKLHTWVAIFWADPAAKIRKSGTDTILQIRIQCRSSTVASRWTDGHAEYSTYRKSHATVPITRGPLSSKDINIGISDKFQSDIHNVNMDWPLPSLNTYISRSRSSLLVPNKNVIIP